MTTDEQARARELLPKPPRYRNNIIVPVSLRCGIAQLNIPRDMTEAEARKIAAVVIAYAKNVTTWNVKALS